MSSFSIKKILWGSFISALMFDLLFWKHTPGISFFIISSLVMLIGILLAYLEGKSPDKRSLILSLPVLFYSAMFFIREEPLTRFVNVILTIVSLSIMALTLRNGFWLQYSLADFVAGGFKLFFSSITAAASAISVRKAENVPDQVITTRSKLQIWPIVRGLLLALPVIVVMASLLSSADPIFSQELNELIDLKNLPELIWRLFYILVLAYLLAGVYIYGIFRSQEQKLIGLEKPWLPPFLGWIEASIVLGAVNLLFLFFVTVQFRYFFGGQDNVHLNGYTYSEYAVRGFNELLVVAILSLLLLQGLSAITRRVDVLKQRIFAGLGVILTGLVVVILISALQRLALYEAVYGFSRLRAYAHVLMIWLGILLVATMVFEVINRQRLFALAVILTAFGFGATLNLLDVDGYIVRQNTSRAETSGKLDMVYLNDLSDDAVPVMFEIMDTSTTPLVKSGMMDVLSVRAACKKVVVEDQSWQSFHLSTSRANSLLASNASRLDSISPSQIYQNYQTWKVEIKTVEFTCP